MSMYFKIAHQDESFVKNIFNNHINKDISLFMDAMPSEAELKLNPINIIVINEPNEYFGLHDWVIKNHIHFTKILTWSFKVLNQCKNAEYISFGDSWFKPDQYEKEHDKTFSIAHLCGKLLLTHGHQLRHEILNRQNEIMIPKNFYYTIGDRYNIENARIGKEQVYASSGFGVCIENVNCKGWFTEKIIDCFLLKSIPVYWGCSNIHEFFNIDGIIKFENIDDCIEKINRLTPEYYIDRLEIIEENYIKAKTYLNFVQRIHDKLVYLNAL